MRASLWLLVAVAGCGEPAAVARDAGSVALDAPAVVDAGADVGPPVARACDGMQCALVLRLGWETLEPHGWRMISAPYRWLGPDAAEAQAIAVLGTHVEGVEVIERAALGADMRLRVERVLFARHDVSAVAIFHAPTSELVFAGTILRGAYRGEVVAPDDWMPGRQVLFGSPSSTVFVVPPVMQLGPDGSSPLEPAASFRQIEAQIGRCNLVRELADRTGAAQFVADVFAYSLATDPLDPPTAEWIVVVQPAPILGPSADYEVGACSIENCPGCCDGTTCRTGRAKLHCGSLGNPCEECTDYGTCETSIASNFCYWSTI